MRARGFSLLTAGILAVTMNAHAAFPNVTAVAMQANLARTLVLQQGKTVRLMTLGATPVTAKVNCLLVESFPNPITVPPLPTVKVNLKRVYGRATSTGTTFYFTFASFAPGQGTAAQVVTGLNFSKNSYTSSRCGAGLLTLYQAAGVANYR